MVSSIRGKESLLSQLTAKTRELGNSFSKLSSGSKINKAADGPAELSVAVSLLTTADLGNKARQNIAYGASAINIADSAVSNINEITNRMSELAVQSANGTLSDANRSALSDEFNALKLEITRLSEATEFNGIKILKGDQISIQAGIEGSKFSRIDIKMPDLAASIPALESLQISTAAGSKNAIEQLKNVSADLFKVGSTLGAGMSRLEKANANIQVSSENASAAASVIRDVDMATESARLISNLILQQSSVSALNQYKLSSANILKVFTS
jgi:flagellin